MRRRNTELMSCNSWHSASGQPSNFGGGGARRSVPHHLPDPRTPRSRLGAVLSAGATGMPHSASSLRAGNRFTVWFDVFASLYSRVKVEGSCAIYVHSGVSFPACVSS